MNDQIEDLKKSINDLTVQLAVVSTKHKILENMVTSIIAAKMPEDYPNIYSNLVDRYEHDINESLDRLYGILYDTGDTAFIIREKMNLSQDVQAMKNDEDYVQQEK